MTEQKDPEQETDSQTCKSVYYRPEKNLMALAYQDSKGLFCLDYGLLKVTFCHRSFFEKAIQKLVFIDLLD